jgi:molybdate/tungstate transport system permease protein
MMQNKMYLLFGLAGVIILLFIILPIFSIIIGTNPNILFETFKDKEVQRSLLLTLYAGVLATLFGLIFGIPLAYLLAKFDFKGKVIIESIIDIPIVIPHTAAGIALLTVFGQHFLLGRLASLCGIKFVGTILGIVIAMSFVSVPFLINSAKEGFRAVEPKLEKVARTLGASAWVSFMKVSLPLAAKGIATGAIMMWARGISEFGAVVIIAYHPMVASVLLYERFESYGLEYSRPVAVLLILVCMIIFISIRILIYKKSSCKINSFVVE